MGFKNLWINMALFGLFVFGLVSFAFTLQVDNPISGVQTLKDDQLLNETFNNLNSELGGIEEKTETQKKAFEQENPLTAFGGLIFFTIISAGKVFNGVTIGVYNVLIKFPATALGISPIVTGIIGGILLVSIIIGLWFMYRGTVEN